MWDEHSERDGLIDTRVNFWPSMVDAVTSVLILMFLLYIVKGIASGEMEAIRARRAMRALQADIEEAFRTNHLEDVVHCEYSTNILRVTFSDAVLFDSGQYVLKPLGQRALRVTAEALGSPAAPPFRQIQVEGHTDSVPMSHDYYPRDNWELASARAITVLKALKNLGVNPPVISANGYADQVKIDRLDEKNRRIELRIIYAIPGLPVEEDQ